jgi:tripartite-type tricarboxylate transporter receptor subunit TctC
MTVKTCILVAKWGIAAGLVAALATSANNSAAQDFYKGKRVTLLIGYAPGGGYDTYARTFARHFPKHIPGAPSIIVKNQPGAGSMKVANYLFNSAPKDGREIAAVGREIPTATLLKTKNANFRSDRFNWIGSLASGVSYCIAWHSVPITKATDLFEKQFIVGGTTGRSPTVVVPLILNNLLNAKVKLISGYPGGAAMHLAMERNEIQGRCAVTTSSLNSSRPDWIRDKKIRFLLEVSVADKRTMPNVPRVIEFAKTDDEKRTLEVLLAHDQWHRPLIAPPDVPAQRVEILRRGFDATVQDAAYEKDIERQKLGFGAMKGAEMERRIQRLQATPENIVQAAMEVQTSTARTEMSKAVVPIEKATGKITKVEKGGRRVSFAAGSKKGKLRVSSSGTKVTIGGNAAKRSALKAGMSCQFAFQGSAAKTIVCK